MSKHRALTTFWLLLAAFALLVIGALQARHDYRTRGIPAGLPQPIHAAETAPGLNVSLEQYDGAALAENLAQIEALGVEHVKQSFHYDENYDWDTSDRLVTAVANTPLTLVPQLDGNPANDFAPVPPAAFAAWTAEFATRYGDQIDAYIIWDEPNLASHWGLQAVNPTGYAAILSAAADAIRKVDPDALIVVAPLAPTSETGPQNLADPLYLQRLYAAGAADAFDVVAGKPYGFDTGPNDRTVDVNALNFSRAILLREVMVANGDAHKPIWAGNWGWNALPPDWRGEPSIWGQTTAAQQAQWTLEALQRARREWPWMGLMFLENWQPAAAPDNSPASDNPRWGFSIKGQAMAESLQTYLAEQTGSVAYPGFHLAAERDPAQVYSGDWRFSPEFGADVGQSGDRVTFTFWGTDVGLRVRRADFRARLYVTVDGQPANALPTDENGTTLVLTAADRAEDYLTIEPIARNLTPGVHTVEIAADRGWDQWALNGFSVAYHPPDRFYRWALGLLALMAAVALVLATRSARRAGWGQTGRMLAHRYRQLSEEVQLAITAVAGLVTALTGWLTWGNEAAGIYRRLGDGGQLVLTAATASIFYAAPSFIVFVPALLALFLLLALRPVWGLVLIAFSFPLYVPAVLKPIFSYRFSPVEIITLLTLAAFLAAHIRPIAARLASGRWQVASSRSVGRSLKKADLAVIVLVGVATLSLFFTERLDVATNEWRIVIVEPALFYLLLRGIRPSRRHMWWLLDAFVAGGVLVALFGLWQYFFDPDSLITAEGGLLRLRAFYGSPNNVALYLDRIVPLLAAAFLLGQSMNQRRRGWYTAVLPLLGIAILFTFSKGGILLGVPAGLLVVFWVWQQRNGRSPWPWIVVAVIVGAVGLLGTQRIPALAGRLDLTSATSFFRLNLWRASFNMFLDHPLLGVGLDNFLYAYRGRYIFNAAWQEPNLNHPHNILLDFGTRLGILGLLVGGWLFWTLWGQLRRALAQASAEWQPVAVGFSGALAATLAHGLVDHSFFLVDLAFTFYLMLATAVWLNKA